MPATCRTLLAGGKIFFRGWLEDQSIPILLTLKPVQVRSQEVPQGAVPDRGEAVQLSDDARQEQR